MTNKACLKHGHKPHLVDMTMSGYVKLPTGDFVRREHSHKVRRCFLCDELLEDVDFGMMYKALERKPGEKILTFQMETVRPEDKEPNPTDLIWYAGDTKGEKQSLIEDGRIDELCKAVETIFKDKESPMTEPKSAVDRIAEAPRAWAVKWCGNPVSWENAFYSDKRDAEDGVGDDAFGEVVAIAFVELEKGE